LSGCELRLGRRLRPDHRGRRRAAMAERGRRRERCQERQSRDPDSDAATNLGSKHVPRPPIGEQSPWARLYARRVAGDKRRHARKPMYGVPYMTASASEHFEITLRGFSPKELNAQAERECRKHFGECAWQINEATCIPCMGTLGG